VTNTKRKIAKRKKVLSEIETLETHSSRILFIHYSCESFYDLRDIGRSARITSIAVRFFETGQSESFSIHKTAEIEKKLDSIEEHYDELEKLMLSGFFHFLKAHENYKWIHWNMRDVGYGFQAISHRFSVLGGKPKEIIDDNKFDLADKLKVIYGSNYIGDPRFEKLIEKNSISKKDFLNGQQEADAFKNKEYIKLHHSTLRKVNMMQTVFDKVLDKNLKTDSKWKERYGLSPQGIFEAIRENWIFNFVLLFLGGLASWIITEILK